MTRPTVFAIVQRSSDRELLRKDMKSFRQIDLISVAANGDSIRGGSVVAEVVVLDPFASDAETVYRVLLDRSPTTKVIVMAKSLRAIASLAIPPELVAIQAHDESFETVVLRFLQDGPDGMGEGLAVAQSSRLPQSQVEDPEMPEAGSGGKQPRSLKSIPAPGLPGSVGSDLAEPDSTTEARRKSDRLTRTQPAKTQPAKTKPVEAQPAKIRADRNHWEPRDPQLGRQEQAGTAPRSGDIDGPIPDPTSRRQPGTSSSSNRTRSIVVLGASTGGPDAVRTVLGGLPATFPLPILIVQHMPAVFTEQFALSLDETVPLKVAEATEGTLPRPGEVWVAPGGFHMEIADVHGRVTLSEGAKLHGCRPAVDILFKSAVKVYGSQVLAVVLTGMGHDGADGCREIDSAGGHVIVQDEATSTVWGMPGSVAENGNAHQIVPLKQIAFTIVGNAASGRARATSDRTAKVAAGDTR